jgi:hypothetical protein
LNESLRQDIDALRRSLDDLVARSDDELMRYELMHPRMPPGLYWKVRWLAGCILRWLEIVGIKKQDPWPAGLKQVPASKDANPLLIWAVGTERDALRRACRTLAPIQSALPGFAPVLVTDVADFAFFSRTGWLVEYLPPLSGEGKSYAERKARFVASLYRAAPALPVTAALEQTSGEEICRWLMNAPDSG